MKTARQEFYLRCARLLWHDILDGVQSLKHSWVRREMTRLLRLSKSTQKDL